ncbi:unnamed protein product [Didymodactylos carnosus]|uniref:Uncharacterized protein n=1 Tax=Didymodactylos carnosus TaxID=1234261 RepID=A0A815AEJ9_9BILA|nr:unnamed protein product [Didymodactylos carnosus]CAF4026308.1 unnamed protein product [Didymodactylos carnosus]
MFIENPTEPATVKLELENIQIRDQLLQCEYMYIAGNLCFISKFQTIREPVQCMNCYRFNHVTLVCKSEQYCISCGDTKDCTSTVFKCVSCGQNHRADNKDCIKYQELIEKLKQQQHNE